MNAHTEYIPPHPQKGTHYHRYTILLLPQKSPISVPVFARDQRLGFSVRDFIETYDLDLPAGGGAFMWREVWDNAVSTVHKEVLGNSHLATLDGTSAYTLRSRDGGAEVWKATEARQVCGDKGKEQVLQVVLLGSPP